MLLSDNDTQYLLVPGQNLCPSELYNCLSLVRGNNVVIKTYIYYIFLQRDEIYWGLTNVYASTGLWGGGIMSLSCLFIHLFFQAS